MSLKRRNTSSPESDDLPAPKRSKPVPPEESSSDIEHPTASHAEPRTDPLYGQRSAFPGLDDDAETLNYGEEPSDGIEYLRMVR